MGILEENDPEVTIAKPVENTSFVSLVIPTIRDILENWHPTARINRIRKTQEKSSDNLLDCRID